MRKIEIFENERATDYDQFVERWIPNYHYFMNHLPDLLSDTYSKELLVVGCGTGNEILRFVNSPERWKITGIDPSPGMIMQAREKLKNHDNVKLIEGLVTDLFPDKKYNAATLLLVLHFIEDNGNKLHILKGIANRLMPGAKFVILDITGDKKQIRDNLEVLKLLLPQGLNEQEISERLNRIENKFHIVSEERLSELLQEAGFEKPLRFFQSSIYMGWITHKIDDSEKHMRNISLETLL
ncbi:MAG: class I SAM-dependent methyltransferase [Proteiniphilum sp.]|jgi:tRNA (cmo5U34)-methyltransferase|uniref:class I SAM-dependent methyltransferase n=1 Tax=Proteiniphilum sp. TaxID=1926877 RepID=UPI002B21D97A|nr:class I SAM-dependent methyltransferase [Proteiniphilum sp.]MEA5062121.1 class I SAM-dependent methyltransferase [Petrimonas sp.]MEA5128962.1 class I SAM-dependent methyltransferase [Proteiniphilum sp.]